MIETLWTSYTGASNHMSGMIDRATRDHREVQG